MGPPVTSQSLPLMGGTKLAACNDVHASVPPCDGKLRQEAKQRKLEACVEFKVAHDALKKAEERLSVERRLFSIKVDRLDK